MTILHEQASSSGCIGCGRGPVPRARDETASKTLLILWGNKLNIGKKCGLHNVLTCLRLRLLCAYCESNGSAHRVCGVCGGFISSVAVYLTDGSTPILMPSPIQWYIPHSKRILTPYSSRLEFLLVNNLKEQMPVDPSVRGERCGRIRMRRGILPYVCISNTSQVPRHSRFTAVTPQGPVGYPNCCCNGFSPPVQ